MAHIMPENRPIWHAQLPNAECLKFSIQPVFCITTTEEFINRQMNSSHFHCFWQFLPFLNFIRLSPHVSLPRIRYKTCEKVPWRTSSPRQQRVRRATTRPTGATASRPHGFEPAFLLKRRGSRGSSRRRLYFWWFTSPPVYSPANCHGRTCWFPPGRSPRYFPHARKPRIRSLFRLSQGRSRVRGSPSAASTQWRNSVRAKRPAWRRHSAVLYPRRCRPSINERGKRRRPRP